MIKINCSWRPSGEWLESSVRHLVSEAAAAPRPSVLLSKMAEALFIETLRRYMEQLPAEQTGWLAGARDPVVGGALALMHSKPFRPWTVADLAAEAGASRSVVAERFPAISAIRRWLIWRAGGCNSRRGCCRRPERRCCR